MGYTRFPLTPALIRRLLFPLPEGEGQGEGKYTVEHAWCSLSQGLFSKGLLTDKLLRHHRGVVSAEAKGVVDRRHYSHFANLVRHVVEIAVRLRMLVVDRRRDEICLN